MPQSGWPLCLLPQPLDHESREHYELVVAVQNEAPLQAAAPRAQRGQARVSVRVQDANEAPVFPENPLRTSLAEGAPPGTPVALFSARDPDTRQLQRIRWAPGAGGAQPRGALACGSEEGLCAFHGVRGPALLCPLGRAGQGSRQFRRHGQSVRSDF